ncbi:XTP/dITP diphosphatase [Bacillus sp. 1NLA3E]|uniref:XTP/dITP diphosphatase n=1 Tax=Bacillus sp. 1NLA3E TaxID=666686 RepID=UPI000247EA23|nr:XTP/dITP diphosphatase [Bacillus sp. 1NLA3E]AGK55125.1 nucleoside-triphosphatase [Bacillus sp. 1NLA3E]
MNEIIIATQNKGKAKEFEQMFAPRGYKVLTLLDFPELKDVEETGATFEENAILKAEAISQALGKMAIADDSGLVVDALAGKPGIYSARYAGEEKNDEANIDKVLKELIEIPDQKRTAHFYCALAVAIPGQEAFTFFGTCEGKILHERKGTNGFGYDPIFFSLEENRSMAELSAEEKNRISHRANALKKLDEQIDFFLAKEAEQ